MVEVKLRIAGAIIQIQSKFQLEQFADVEKRIKIEEGMDEQERIELERRIEDEKKINFEKGFNDFIYGGRKKSDILINVKVVDKLPEVSGIKPIFTTYYFQNGKENWRLLKKGNIYFYKCPLENKKQLMIVEGAFDRIDAYLLPGKDSSPAWNIADIIYDFLQVLLINYFAQRNSGIFIHSLGVKNLDGEGLIFAGISGAGKSTMAKIWNKYSKAKILNDDRIIVRKPGSKLFIYGSPWHGDFDDYFVPSIESAPLKKLFFIHPAPNNSLRRISQKEAFNLLYPALFPTFWNKEWLENITSFCQDLIKNVPCFSLGFVNNKRILQFIKKVAGNKIS